MDRVVKRDERIDVLRAIGLLAIVLAHVHPPDIVFQMRNFDVPLMVMVSGAAFGAAVSKRPAAGYFSYLGARVFRLVIPTWIFLSVFFVAALVASSVLSRPYPFTIEEVAGSFGLMTGIGYVWVVRVLLLVAIVAPVIDHIDSRPSERKLFLALLIGVYCVYELCVWLILPSVPETSALRFALREVVCYMIPYGGIFWLGKNVYLEDRRNLAILGGISFFIFASFAVYYVWTIGRFIPSQVCKYPPTLYYLAYAVSVCFFAYYFVSTNSFLKLAVRAGFVFLGRSSLWIYLWHILILFGVQLGCEGANFAIKFVVVLMGATVITAVQKRILVRILKEVESRSVRDKLLMVFGG